MVTVGDRPMNSGRRPAGWAAFEVYLSLDLGGSNDRGVDLGETCAFAEIDAVGFTYGPVRTCLVLPLLVGDRGVTSSGWVRVRSLTCWPAGPLALVERSRADVLGEWFRRASRPCAVSRTRATSRSWSTRRISGLTMNLTRILLS
jgi:hypothetical protein